MIKKSTSWIAALALTLILIFASAESQAQCFIEPTSPTSQNICLGSTGTLSCSGGWSRQWYRNGVAISGATGNNYTTPAVTMANNGDVYTVRFDCTFGDVWSDPAVITVTTTVSITTQPVTQTICQGSTTTFTVAATGGGLTYRWRRNGTNLNNGGTISGVTTTTLTITNTAAANAGTYTVAVTNDCGTVISNGAVLTVGAPPAITAHPASATRCAGTSVTFSVTASNAGSYQWQKDGVDIGGATAATYTISSPVAGDAGNYRVIVSSPGCTSVTSNNASLTVNTAPSISVHPVSQGACPGTSVTFTVTATGTGLSYQWRRGATNVGTNSNSYTVSNVSAANTGNYTVIVSGTCTPSVTSNVAVLSLNVAPSISTQPAAVTVCEGSPATLTVTASGTSLSYQWRRNGTNVGSPSATSSYTIPAVATGDAGNYSVVITGACNPSVTSSSAALTVNTAPAISVHPVSQAVCPNSPVTFTVTASGTGLSYQWKRGVTNVGTNSNTLNIASVGAGQLGNYTVVVSGTCTPAVTSNIAVLSHNSAPSISTHPVSQAICPGAPVTFNVTASGTGLTYQWRKNGSNIGAPTATPSYTIASVAAGDVANYSVVVIGTCTPNATSNNAALTLNAVPDITAQPAALQTQCVGTNVTFSVTATGTGLSYQWKKGLANVGTNSNTYTINNIDALDAGIYSVVVSGTCTPAETSNPAVLVVNILPAISIQPLPQTTCLGLPVTFNVTAGGTGLLFQWQKDGVNIGGANSNTLNIASASASDAGNYSVVINGSCAPIVTSNNASLTVNTSNVWSGVGANWTTGSNWSCGSVPTSALDVTIPNGVTFYPVVPAGATASVRNMTIANGASLTLTNSTSTMQVYGDWTNNGTFTANNGTIAFNGTAAQNIAGTNTTNFHHLTVNNTAAAVSLGHDENVSGTLTLNNNTTFTATGYELVLTSDASNTGRIGAVPASATFNGNVRMQRYIPAKGGRYWYQLASPVTGTMVGHWQNAFAITGYFWGASAPGNGINPSGASMYTWGAGTGLWQRYPSVDNSESIVPGTGYRTFVRDGNAAYNGGATTTKTFSSAGIPTIGNFNFVLPYHANGGTPAGGWNLIGNPYPSDINGDLNSAGWTSKTNLDGLAIYMWDSDAQSYVTCNGGVGNCIVPSSQAFWVKVNPGGGSLTASESVKVSGSQSFYREASEGPNYIPVKIVNNATQENDVLYLRFENDATESFDNQYDAYKLIMGASGVVGNSVSLYSQMNTINYSIMARPVPMENDTIPLTIAGPSGNHSFDFSDNNNLQAEYSLFLIDKAENTVTDLRANSIYDFHITGQVSSYENRFYVVFKYTAEEDEEQEEEEESTTGVNDNTESADVNVYPNPVTSENIQITLPENLSGNIEISIVDMKGTQVYSENREASSTLSVTLAKKLKSGVYMLMIQSEGKQYRKKIVVQ